MNTEIELNEMILGISNNIRDNHPELLKHLNEMPITVPYHENPEISVGILKTYYDSLVVLVDEYKNKKFQSDSPNIVESLPTTDVIIMELNNSYQNLLIEINNISISYNEAGNGNIPVIFLHGFPFDKSMWMGQLDSLKSSMRVIAYDIRGFGESKDEISPLSIKLFSEDLLLFMDKLNIEKAIICGLSMGGYIVLNAVERFPERFAALILCDTQCIADTDGVKEKRYNTIEQINSIGASEFNEKFSKSVFYSESLTNKIEIVESVRSIVFANSDRILMAGLTALAERSETCSGLDAINIPTLIICGKEDDITPVGQSQFMHKHIGGSSLKIIENAGHVSNIEQPEIFNQYLLEFLNSINS